MKLPQSAARCLWASSLALSLFCFAALPTAAQEAPAQEESSTATPDATLYLPLIPADNAAAGTPQEAQPAPEETASTEVQPKKRRWTGIMCEWISGPKAAKLVTPMIWWRRRGLTMPITLKGRVPGRGDGGNSGWSKPLPDTR